MDRYEKATEIARKLMRKEYITEAEWRLLGEVIEEYIEEEERKELH